MSVLCEAGKGTGCWREGKREADAGVKRERERERTEREMPVKAPKGPKEACKVGRTKTILRLLKV